MEAKDALKLAIMRSTAAWFEAFGAIQVKGGAVGKYPNLLANELQRHVSDVIEWCVIHHKPCRLIILKPRQKGCSTFSVAAFYRWLANDKKRGCIIGGAHDQGDNLFKMLRLYAENDEFAGTNKAKVLDREARWPNGSRAVQQTARNPEAGRSGTFEALIATEVARWAEEGVANAADVLAGLLKCVPNLPGTLVILESTASGASGDFYERWQKGISFDDLKQGKEGFVKIFAPWFVFKDSRRDPSLEGLMGEADYSEKERELAERHELDLWQVAWMRWAIREECKGDFDTFCQDYPFDDDTAFLRSGRRRFNVGCINRMKESARIYPPTFGVFEKQGEEVVFRTTPPEEALVMRWEEPREGCAYLASVDVMTGSSQVSGKDPDNHAPLLWRKGYFENGRGWVPPRLVCRLIGDWPEWERNKRYELRWDIDVLEEQVWRMSQYYGNCLIVPEMNMDRGLVELLKLRGANIYQREIFNRREMTLDKALGWMTDARTREMAIEVLAKHVREYGHSSAGVDIHCPILLAEMENFIVKENGRSEAMNGKHDDNVMSCFRAGTMVRCRHGAIPIELVRVGDEVLTHRGRWRKVTATATRKADIVEIKAVGKPLVGVSPEHPFYVLPVCRKYKPLTQGMILDYGAPEFVSIERMGPKDWGASSIPLSEEVDLEKIDLLEFVSENYKEIGGELVATTYGGRRINSKANRIPRMLCIDRDLCRFIGFYFAQGSVGRHSVVLSMNKQHTGIRDWLIAWLGSLGLKPVWNLNGGNAATINFGSVPISNWLRSFGKGTSKRFPAWIETLIRSKQRWILEGYFLGDGCFSNGEAKAVSVSATGAWQLWEMCMRNKLAATFSYCKHNGLGGCRVWGLTLARPAAQDLKAGIESVLLRGKINGTSKIRVDQTNVRFIDDLLVGKILKKNPAGCEQVFNLSVDEDESYTANGYVVHNCAIGLSTIEGATVYRERVRERPLPRDLRIAEMAMQRGRGRAQYS